MPGEAPPEPTDEGPQAVTAATRQVPVAAEFQGVAQTQREEQRLVAWSPAFASGLAHFLAETCTNTFEVLRDRTYVVATLSDVLREVGGLGVELMCYIDGQLCETTLVKKFQQEPLVYLFPVVSAGLMMSCIGICYSFMYLPAMKISVFSMPSVIFHTSFCLAFVSYHQGVVTHPGRVPSSWKGSPSGRPRFTLKEGNTRRFAPLERKKTTNGYRFCKYEDKFKPDRAHYCKVMGQNVLRMDHYCPWLANCVGLRNYKYFFLTIFYDTIAANMVNCSMIHALHVGGHSAIHVFMLSQGVVIATVSSCVLTPFCLFHCWLMSRNLTTIEYCEKGRERQETLSESPYDLGPWHNISSALGKEWYLWFLPVRPSVGDGLDYPVAAAFEYKKTLLPNTVVAAGLDLQPRGIASAAAEEAASSGDEVVLLDGPGDENNTDVADAVEPPPVRMKCGAARDGTAMSIHVLEKAAVSMASGVSACTATLGTGLARLWEQESAAAAASAPQFVQGGLEAFRECSNDFCSYSSEKMQDACTWFRPKPTSPPPRMASTVAKMRSANVANA